MLLVFKSLEPFCFQMQCFTYLDRFRCFTWNAFAFQMLNCILFIMLHIHFFPQILSSRIYEQSNLICSTMYKSAIPKSFFQFRNLFQFNGIIQILSFPSSSHRCFCLIWLEKCVHKNFLREVDFPQLVTRFVVSCFMQIREYIFSDTCFDLHYDIVMLRSAFTFFAFTAEGRNEFTSHFRLW